MIADRRAKVDYLIEVVDLCKLAGANAVTVATEKEGVLNETQGLINLQTQSSLFQKFLTVGMGVSSLGVSGMGLGWCLLSLVSNPPQKEVQKFESNRVLERMVKKQKPKSKSKPKKQRVRRRQLSTPKPNLSTDLSQLGSGVPLFAIQGADLSISSLLKEGIKMEKSW